MKTSKLGIGYDLEIIQVGHKSIEVLATTEDGDKSFWIEFENNIQDDQTFHAELLDGNTQQLTSDDLAEVESWIEGSVVTYLVSEAVKLCVRKSNDKEYWHCVYHADTHFSLNIFQQEKLGSGYKSAKSHHAWNEIEARTLLNELK